MPLEKIAPWLLQGDVSIQFQAYRDLLGIDRADLQERIAREGWGRRFLSRQKPGGHWGDRFYLPKWTSTHYTLLDLRNLNISPDNKTIQNAIETVLDRGKAEDGGIPLGPSTYRHSDVCVNGMFLNYASYFKMEEKKLRSLADNILQGIMRDGGFNCNANTIGAKHGSMHSTISVLEGITEYGKNGYKYRLQEMERAKTGAIGFLLTHRLFQSDRTGEIINKNFLKLSFPGRWRYDILRALDYLQYEGIAYEDRIAPALEVLLAKRNKNNIWNLQAKHAGKVHFDMERAGRPSRWNTLRAMRVLKHFRSECL